MKQLVCACLMLLALFVGVAFGDEPLLIFDKLAVPLQLPPGLKETLPLNHKGSFFGDALRAVDCPASDYSAVQVRFGTCGNQFFGGIVMTDSHLTGSVTIEFSPPVGNVAHFIVRQGVLTGEDSNLSAPLGFNMPVKANKVTDAKEISSGDVDLTTGGVTNLKWYTLFSNTALLALGGVNPKLPVPTIQFPGVRGHAWATFTQRKDGLLDFYFRGSTFLPLTDNIAGDVVRFPLPFCGPAGNCGSIPARGTSLHPHLYLDTRADLGLPPCAPNCPDIPFNRTQVFTINSRYSSYGDDFDLDIPALGGAGPGRSELQGRLEIQFGPQVGDTVPFVINSRIPEGLFSDPPGVKLFGELQNEFKPGLIGPDQRLIFPKAVYPQHKLSYADEVLNFPQGMIDLKSGYVLGEMEYPLYIDQSIIEVLVPVNKGRVSTEPFFLIAQRAPQNLADPTYAFFEKGRNGQTTFRGNLFHHRSYATYCYPTPALEPDKCIGIGGPEGNLNIFQRLQAGHLPDPANPGSYLMKDSRAFTSSIGDQFSYNLSVPCDAKGPFSVTYTNNNSGPSGGTFTMKHLTSVSCTNSAVSSAGKGAYDQIAVTGYGTWSKDPQASGPDIGRFMAASFSLDAANPYGLIMVFARQPGEVQELPNDDTRVIISSAENKPPKKPTP